MQLSKTDTNTSQNFARDSHCENFHFRFPKAIAHITQNNNYNFFFKIFRYFFLWFRAVKWNSDSACMCVQLINFDWLIDCERVRYKNTRQLFVTNEIAANEISRSRYRFMFTNTPKFVFVYFCLGGSCTQKSILPKNACERSVSNCRLLFSLFISCFNDGKRRNHGSFDWRGMFPFNNSPCVKTHYD